jgi:hypothetical protein
VLESKNLELFGGVRGQDQQKPLLFPDIRRFVETQRGIVHRQNNFSINTQVPNVDQLRSIVAMIFSRFKDLTVHGTGAMPQTRSTLNNSEIVAGVTIGKINAA